MEDPWKYVAFPAAAVAGFLVSRTALSAAVQGVVNLSPILSDVAVVAGTGLLAGFVIDEMVPAYLERLRSGGPGDAGGGMENDFDGDMDFGE